MFDSVHIIIISEICNYLGANSEKLEKHFRLKINMIAWKMEKNCFQINFEKSWLWKFWIRVILDTYL